jgi:hypothetical protein
LGQLEFDLLADLSMDLADQVGGDVDGFVQEAQVQLGAWRQRGRQPVGLIGARRVVHEAHKNKT